MLDCANYRLEAPLKISHCHRSTYVTEELDHHVSADRVPVGPRVVGLGSHAVQATGGGRSKVGGPTGRGGPDLAARLDRWSPLGEEGSQLGGICPIFPDLIVGVSDQHLDHLGEEVLVESRVGSPGQIDELRPVEGNGDGGNVDEVTQRSASEQREQLARRELEPPGTSVRTR